MSEGNTLLRTLTLKSKIKFGYNPDLIVQELIILDKHIELIRMYYNLAKIDFDEQVKDILKLTKDRQIVKPGKDYNMYYKHIGGIMDDIRGDQRLAEIDNPSIKWNRYKEKKNNEKHNYFASKLRHAREHSKGINKLRNQK